MPQPTPEVDAFIERIQALPPGLGISLDAALRPSLDEETELRMLFATDRLNPRLSNCHVGLVDVFAAPDAIRTTRARVVQGKEDLFATYVMPVSEKNRRKEGAPCMVADLDEFKKNWAIFTEGSLTQLIDWNNVVAAGGSVLACLAPLDDTHKASKRAIRKYYHSNAYPTSDVDLFLWGLNAEQAEAKVKQIYEAVRDSVPWDVTCIRTKHTVSIHSQYPYRSVQIILRLYHSPAEVLAGFDIDAPCCAYDGNRVWANPRSVIAMMRQCNTVDMTRRSPSYEVRLAKYAERFYEVYIPTLEREKIDPTIYERSIVKIKGLARLLVLEMLKDDHMHSSFVRERRLLRDRPGGGLRLARRNRRKYKGDLKQDMGINLEMNDYDVGSLHIPYGPRWDAKRIAKLIYQTDLGMNSTFNPKNKGRRLHRHPAFFGTADEVLDDCCEHCPEPIDKDEEELQQEEDEMYIRGKVSFIEDNPGRQSMTGSFNPIDEGEWGEQAYILPAAQLFQAIVTHDRATVQRLLKTEDAEVNVHHRDHVGRTVLHIAILVKAVDIAEDLIDAGARITARLADGRTPLHLAAQYDSTRLISKLLERSRKNEEDLETEPEEATPAKAPERPSSEDDWSSHDDEDVVMSESEGDEGDDEEEAEDEEGGEDEEEENEGEEEDEEEDEDEDEEDDEDVDDKNDEPDIIDVNTHDWDFGFTALCYAVLFGSLPTLTTLLTAGADPKLPTNPSPSNSYLATTFHPLTLTVIRKDDIEACAVAESLIEAGATSTTADEAVRTIFHHIVGSGRARLVETILRCDPDVSKVVNLPYLQSRNVVFPVATAIHKKHYATLVHLITHGAKLQLEESDVTKARDAATPSVKNSMFGYQEVENYLHLAHQPLELALKRNDDIAQLLIALGVTVDFGLKKSLDNLNQSKNTYYYNEANAVRRTLKDWVEFGIKDIAARIAKMENVENPASSPMNEVTSELPKSSWLIHLKGIEDSLKNPDDKVDTSKSEANEKKDRLEKLEENRKLLVEIQTALSERHAKTWRELYPDAIEPTTVPGTSTTVDRIPSPPPNSKAEREYAYTYLSDGSYYSRDQPVPQHLHESYDELYEACYMGDNEKISRFCLPDPEVTSTAGTPSPLNISVRVTNKAAVYNYRTSGYTPLFAAIAGRRWSTAKLILAIATAQYCPENDGDELEFDSNVMDTDSDTESDASYDSDITIEQERVTFTDIATRPSKVQSSIHPKRMLEVSTEWRKRRHSENEPSLVGPETGDAIPIAMAIIQHDSETFVHIANLYQSLPQPLPLPTLLLDIILQEDQAQILDEYIKRTGDGVDVNEAQESSNTGPLPAAINDENKVYLGLNVHGKKRADLAKKNDPNATRDYGQTQPPLLWRAIRQKAASVVSYFHSERPLAAYRHFASVSSDSKAIWFKRLGLDKGGDLEKWLPTWLGWTSDSLGESPLSAAIISGDVAMVKLVAKLDPKLMTSCLQTEIKFFGLNPLLLAVGSSADVKVIDYLLSRTVSPGAIDAIKGWNIYHFVCATNKGDLLKYFLEKLPRDVNESLLAQKSRLRGNTPLHIAVKSGYEKLVHILVEYSKDGLLTRDIDGQTPLHCAVARSFASIVKTLLDIMPGDGLVMENGVGNTPVEIITLAELVQRVKQLNDVVSDQGSLESLDPSSIDVFDSRIPTSSFTKYEAEFKELRSIIKDMGYRETSAESSGLKDEVEKWVNKVEVILVAAKAREARKEAERKARDEEKKKKQLTRVNQYPSASASVSNTFEVVKKHAQPSLGPGATIRQLIHLLDVQKSVKSALCKVNPNAVENEYNDCRGLSSDQYASRYEWNRLSRASRGEDDGFEQEANEEKAKKKGMVSKIFQTEVDRL